MMESSIGVRCATLLGASLLAVAGTSAARAQMSSDPAEITSCLCMQQGVATLSSDMSAKTQALAGVRQHLADLDGQLVSQRHYDVNNPDSVARYKALLEQRDAAYQQSLGPVVTDADQATARYNAHVNEYNGRCANHEFDSAMMAQIQAHLSCPPLQ
jgi:TolA-binding protein